MLARPAAIKLIRVNAMSDGGEDSAARRALRRFEREAQATAALTSPHTVELYDFGITDDGTFYYVMELLQGLDLKSLVERAGPVPAQRAIRFLRQACHSLADAHENGLVHRDVKPANLFACRRGLEYDYVKVLDFGLVKDAGLDDGDDKTQLTLEGAASGTPGFMAPEIASGDHAIDRRADIYGLGCVAYWLLCGRLVFEGKTPMAILLQHMKDNPPPPSARTELAIPPSFERIVLDCLAKDPKARPPSAQELEERLAEVERDVGVWTQDQAARWWRAQMPDLAAVTRGGGAESVAAAVGGGRG
jgi:serine/threonine-protein kinase